MIRFRFFALLVLLVLAIGMESSAQIVNTTSSYLGSPRIIAMGGAYIAVADDANAVFLNPAGLGKNSEHCFLANYGYWEKDIRQSSFMITKGLGEHGGLGIGYNLIGAYNIPIVDSSGNPVGVRDWYNGDIAVSYGKQIYEGILFGITGHRLSVGGSGANDVADLSASNAYGYGLNVGIVATLFKNMRIGLLFGNLYATNLERESGINETIPKSAVFGVAYRAMQTKALFALDLQSDNIENNAEIDAISIGGEFSLHEWFKFRLGVLYLKNNSSNYTGGGSAGIGLDLLNNLRFDYAWRRTSGGGIDSHYFSLGYEL